MELIIVAERCRVIVMFSAWALTVSCLKTSHQVCPHERQRMIILREKQCRKAIWLKGILAALKRSR